MYGRGLSSPPPSAPAPQQKPAQREKMAVALSGCGTRLQAGEQLIGQDHHASSNQQTDGKGTRPISFGKTPLPGQLNHRDEASPLQGCCKGKRDSLPATTHFGVMRGKKRGKANKWLWRFIRRVRCNVHIQLWLGMVTI